jgi:DNA (cytosine-5)-methyltransferase 1
MSDYPGIIVANNLNHYRNDQMNRVYSPTGISPTILVVSGGGREIKIMSENMRIRKLTPKECWRLMGFSDKDFEKAEKVNSNSQLYKQAGNSIVVDVLEELFCMMLDEDGELFV